MLIQQLTENKLTNNFSFFQGYSPIPQKKSLAQCQIECYNFEDCQFWSYEIPSQQCYLKTKQNKPTKGVNFISGIKNCSNLVKIRNSELPGQIHVILNQNQKLSVLPADFGQRILTNTEVIKNIAFPV